MYNTFSLGWVEFEEKSSKNISKNCFWKLLESFVCISYYENWFFIWFFAKFQVFQNFYFSTGSSTDWKSPEIRPKLTTSFNSYSIPTQLVKICLTVPSIATRFLSTDRNQIFQNFKGLIDRFCPFSFSSIAIWFLILDFFFFWVKATMVFSLITSKTLILSFHSNYKHSHKNLPFFFKSFELTNFGVFDDFGCFY